MIRLTSIETARLILRHFRDDDVARFYAYRNDPEIARYQSWEAISLEQARDFIAAQKAAQPGVPGEWFQFAIELKASDVMIGDCALHRERDEPRLAEMGYTLAREHQHQGFATEAITALLDYAFREFDLHRMIAIVNTRNSPSVNLLERLGLRREAHFIQHTWFKGGWADEYLYAILRDEWLNKMQNGKLGA